METHLIIHKINLYYNKCEVFGLSKPENKLKCGLSWFWDF